MQREVLRGSIALDPHSKNHDSARVMDITDQQEAHNFMRRMASRHHGVLHGSPRSSRIWPATSYRADRASSGRAKIDGAQRGSGKGAAASWDNRGISNRKADESWIANAEPW